MERTGIVQHLLPCIREARQAFKTIASQGGNRLLRFREREEATVTSRIKTAGVADGPGQRPGGRTDHRLDRRRFGCPRKRGSNEKRR